MSDNSKIVEQNDLVAVKRGRKKTKDEGDTEKNAIMLAQKRCLVLFNILLDQNIHNFWPDHRIDEEFVELFIRTGFDML